MSYQQMAQVYDRLMADAPYDQWKNFTTEMIRSYHPDTRSILDLGCGTGEITRRLRTDGYQLTGVDLSAEMLSIAEQKATDDIQWLKQDITRLEGLQHYDCVISYCDVMNYLTEESQVQAAINNAYHALNQNGLFLFDVHSKEHMEAHLMGETFAEVYDDLSYVWFCDPGEEEGSVIHDLTFFVQQEDQYVRFDEQHEQRAYAAKDIINWIEEAGFVLKRMTADFDTQPKTDGNRLFFVCQKV
ncbi:class I SAM-dependent methyltransferase [Halobacillus litoralis]|uniref:class I SAM-dependent DNA methyltransferase n=1 Tax=Halobacillus litoralis TaxID=45668 RepID=UPI001CD34AC2|nr:class I SAM-dependent methyltransferase [Halobacillus litoralis]MCA0970012.1 class I SAM-dependent methyltransferase [Halobacillus litoralis]